MVILTFDSMIDGCLSLFGSMDADTRLHSLRVGRLCENIADVLSLDQALLYTIGVMHDVGKIIIPSSILTKRGELTDEEREIINIHSIIGGKILRDLFPNECKIYLPVAFHHGPNVSADMMNTDDREAYVSLWNMICSNEELYLLTCIVHIADYFDARTTKRAYHEPIPPNEALEALNRSHILYDERVIKALNDNNYFNHEKIKNSNTGFINGINMSKIIRCANMSSEFVNNINHYIQVLKGDRS